MDAASATAPAMVMHQISAPAPASAFTVAGDAKSAGVTGVAPFLTGTAAFAAESAFGANAAGALSGDLTARFDSTGALQVAAGGPDAILSQR